MVIIGARKKLELGLPSNFSVAPTPYNLLNVHVSAKKYTLITVFYWIYIIAFQIFDSNAVSYVNPTNATRDRYGFKNKQNNPNKRK